MSFSVRTALSIHHNLVKLTHRFAFEDTGAGHNIVVPALVAEDYYSQVPGAYLDNTKDNLTVWYVDFLKSLDPQAVNSLHWPSFAPRRYISYSTPNTSQ